MPVQLFAGDIFNKIEKVGKPTKSWSYVVGWYTA